MTIRSKETAQVGGVPRYNIFASPVGPQIMLDREDGTGGGGDDEAKKAAAEKAAAEKAAAEKEAAEKAARDKSNMTDAEAKLLKEVMEKKEKLKQAEDRLRAFDGLDPEEIKKLVSERAQAEKDRLEAEKKAAEAAGDVERLKKAMAEEHKKEIEAVHATAKTAQDALAAALQQIDGLTVGTAFSNSQFIKNDLVLTPAKARKVYGDHFESVDGGVVAYDKPKGAAERTKLVDSSGNSVSFDEAMKRLVEADPDRDAVVKSKLAPGAGSKGRDEKNTTTKTTELRGAARIQAALAARKAK